MWGGLIVVWVGCGLCFGLLCFCGCDGFDGLLLGFCMLMDGVGVGLLFVGS